MDGDDSCRYAQDGVCNEPDFCTSGTDISDCWDTDPYYLDQGDLDPKPSYITVQPSYIDEMLGFVAQAIGGLGTAAVIAFFGSCISMHGIHPVCHKCCNLRLPGYGLLLKPATILDEKKQALKEMEKYNIDPICAAHTQPWPLQRALCTRMILTVGSACGRPAESRAPCARKIHQVRSNAFDVFACL